MIDPRTGVPRGIATVPLTFISSRDVNQTGSSIRAVALFKGVSRSSISLVPLWTLSISIDVSWAGADTTATKMRRLAARLSFARILGKVFLKLGLFLRFGPRHRL